MNSVRDREARSERPKRARRHEVLSRRAARTLVGLVALIFLPIIPIGIVITHRAGPDLFDLTPVALHSGQYLILPWPELERGRHALHTGAISSGALICALGYIDRKSTRLNSSHLGISY